jgi:hypothetical protein
MLKSFSKKILRVKQLVGFDLNYWGLWERGEKVDMEELWRIYRRELEKVIF